MLLVIGESTRIPMDDETLDRVAEKLEECAREGSGFWISGHLVREVDGEPADPDPAHGHQRLWVHPSQLVSLIYDRPLDPNPETLPANVIPFGPRRD